MDKFTKTKLLREGVANQVIDGETYFAVEDVKVRYKEVKINVANIRTLSNTRYIKVEDIEPYTDFDGKIKQALNFNPRKK
jgi:hypothetical protein